MEGLQKDSIEFIKSGEKIESKVVQNYGYLQEKEGRSMDWEAKYIDKLDKDIDSLKGIEQRITQHFDLKINELATELRHLDAERSNEVRHLDSQRVDDMREIRESLKSTRSHVQNLTIAATVGIATMVLTAIGMVITLILR